MDILIIKTKLHLEFTGLNYAHPDLQIIHILISMKLYSTNEYAILRYFR